MALNLDDKKRLVDEVADIAANSLSVVAAEYRGLTVGEMTALRAQAREGGSTVRVVKNNLAKRAFADTDFACMGDVLKGPIVLVFAHDDPGAAARVCQAFAKEHSAFKVQGLTIGGALLAANQVDAVASLPTYDQAISQLMALMKAPVEKLARTMNEVPGKLVRTVAAIKEAKEAA